MFLWPSLSLYLLHGLCVAHLRSQFLLCVDCIFVLTGLCCGAFVCTVFVICLPHSL